MSVSLCTFKRTCFCFYLMDESYFTDSYNPLSYGSEVVCVQLGITTGSLLAKSVRDLPTLPRLVNVIVHMIDSLFSNDVNCCSVSYYDGNIRMM